VLFYYHSSTSRCIHFSRISLQHSFSSFLILGFLLTFHQTHVLPFRSGLYCSTHRHRHSFLLLFIFSSFLCIVSPSSMTSVSSFGRNRFAKLHHTDTVHQCMNTSFVLWKDIRKSKPGWILKERAAPCRDRRHMSAYLTMICSERVTHAATCSLTCNTHGLSRLQTTEPPSFIEAPQCPRKQREPHRKLEPRH